MKRIFQVLKTENGVVHIIPLLVMVAAVGVISYLLISSSAPFQGGLFSVLFPKPQSQAATGGFLETFAYGAFSSPTAFRSPRWIVGYAGNQTGQWALESSPGNFNIDDYTHDIMAGHGPHCEAPMGNADPNLNVHPIKNNRQVDLPTYIRDWAPQQFYICNNHMMSVSLSGFDASFFMPRYL